VDKRVGESCFIDEAIIEYNANPSGKKVPFTQERS
jgi:hypothetical protein